MGGCLEQYLKNALDLLNLELIFRVKLNCEFGKMAGAYPIVIYCQIATYGWYSLRIFFKGLTS